MDLFLEQAKRDLERTLAESRRAESKRNDVAHRFLRNMRNIAYGDLQDQPGRFMADRIYRHGKLVAVRKGPHSADYDAVSDPSHDDGHAN